MDERLAEYFNEPAGDDDDDGADENGPSGVTVTNEPKSTASSSKAPASPLSWSTESEYRPRFNVRRFENFVFPLLISQRRSLPNRAAW